MGGKLVVRVEDTDQERSSREFEESQMNDLKWLGIEWDESAEKNGEFRHLPAIRKNGHLSKIC